MASFGILFAGFSIVMPLVLFGLLVVLVVGVSTARSEPDPHHHRLPATYLTAVSFVLVFTLLFAVTAAVASVTSLIGDDDSFSASAEAEDFGEGFGSSDDLFEPRPPIQRSPVSVDDDDAEQAASGALAALIVAGVAGGMLWHFRRTLLDLLDADGFRDGPGARVVHAYLYATQFVAVLVLVGAAAVTLYGLAQIVLPGVLSESDAEDVRQGGARLLLTAGALAGGAAGIAVLHMREHQRVDGRPAEGGVTLI